MENSKKYWHFSLTKLAWVGLGLSVASLAVDIWAGINQYHWVLYISFILGICSIIFFFVSPMIENRRVIGKAYENNLMPTCHYIALMNLGNALAGLLIKEEKNE